MPINWGRNGLDRSAINKPDISKRIDTIFSIIF